MNVPRPEGSLMGQLSPRGEERKCPPFSYEGTLPITQPDGGPRGSAVSEGKDTGDYPFPVSEGIPARRGGGL